jgi:hypothetical protein
MFTRANARFVVVSFTALVGVFASLGGGWFEGS